MHTGTDFFLFFSVQMEKNEFPVIPVYPVVVKLHRYRYGTQGQSYTKNFGSGSSKMLLLHRLRNTDVNDVNHEYR
jgi:hypothetical protein